MTASTAAPRLASRAPAKSASPPLSPLPASTTTLEPGTFPTRPALTDASPAAARCISAPGGNCAIRACSAARTLRTWCAYLIPRPPPSRCSSRHHDSARHASGGFPAGSAAPATVPRISSRGQPDASRITSTSVQLSPAGAPSALATASFAAKVAARDSGRPPRSLSANSRAAKRRGTPERRLEAPDVHHVHPDANDHLPSLPRDRVGRGRLGRPEWAGLSSGRPPEAGDRRARG